MALGGGVADATQGVARADSRRVEGATGHVRKRLDSTELQPLAPLIMEPMTPLQTPPTDDACYLAFKARDARFEGCFFTGVTSTRIYCRPVCRVRTARRENCRFFAYAAQAEQAVSQASGCAERLCQRAALQCRVCASLHLEPNPIALEGRRAPGARTQRP